MVSAVGFLGRAGWCARLMWAPRVSAASAVDAVYARSCCAAFLKTSEVFSQLEGKSSSFRFTRNYLAAVNWSTATAAAKQSRRALKLGPAPPPNPRATCICPPAPAALPGPAGSVLFYFGKRTGFDSSEKSYFWQKKARSGLPTQPRISYRHRRRSHSGRAAQKTSR